MGVKAKGVRVKQLVRDPVGGVDIGGGLGNTKDYWYSPYEHEGEDKVRELFEDDWGELDPREFQVEYVEEDGPHAGDPIFRDAANVGHDLKIQDPDDCEIWAWGMPDEMPRWDEPRVRWVQLTICRAGFEGHDDWTYDAEITDDAGEQVEYDSFADWPAARRGIEAYRGKVEVGDELEVINRHRRQLGMAPLDPGAGWTADELKQMAESIRTTGKMYNPRRGKALKRRLLR